MSNEGPRVEVAALRSLIERAHREIDSGLLPSCQLALARDGELVAYETLGDAASDSRYVIFSCTKGVTAGAVWLLMGDGELDVTTRVAELIPEFATNGKDIVTVEQLLTHTSGFPSAPMDPAKAGDRAYRLAQYERWRLNWEPGSRFEYHPTSAHWVLGDVIDVVSGRPAREFVDERISTPLGLEQLALGEPPERQGDINDLVAVGEDTTPEALEAAIGIAGINLSDMVGEVTTDALVHMNDPAIRASGGPGSGGISTAADLALYYQALLRNPDGLWDPVVLADGTGRVRVDLPDALRGVPAHRSLGLTIAGEGDDAKYRGFGHGVSPRTFGHDGAAGQIAWADPDSRISFAYLTNGVDRDLLRHSRRSIGLSSRAAACA